MRKFKEYPDVEEYVIATVTGINPNSAFVTLDEYNNRTGMLHVSEVANTWVRDIRQFVNTGQKLVLKVVATDKEKGHINLSLKRVKPSAKREKTAEYKNEKKAESMMRFVQKELDLTEKEREAMAYELQKNFGLLYPIFETAAAKNGESALREEGIRPEWAKAIASTASKNIKAKEVEVRGILTMKSYNSNGLEILKKILWDISKNAQVDVKYISAPHYQLTVKGADYPTVEKALTQSVDYAITTMRKNQGEAEFARAV